MKLALEPECASVFSQNIPHVKGTARLPITIGGAKYVVVDVGGMHSINIIKRFAVIMYVLQILKTIWSILLKYRKNVKVNHKS